MKNKQCSSACVDGYISANCIEYDESNTVSEKLISMDNILFSIDKKFNKTVDGKTLATGQDLLATVQVLVDRSIKGDSAEDIISNTFSVDLSCLLGDSCTTITTQEQLNVLLIKEICALKAKINSLQTNY